MEQALEKKKEKEIEGVKEFHKTFLSFIFFLLLFIGVLLHLVSDTSWFFSSFVGHSEPFFSYFSRCSYIHHALFYPI